jgi:histidinol dehydrogenase
MENVERIVKDIIAEVKRDGDKALVKFTRDFDGCSLEPRTMRISAEVLKDSINAVSREYIRALQKAIKNIENYQRKVLPKSWQKTSAGVTLGERYNPLESVGLYIPGGRYPYPSTVLMTAIPARVAGVKKIVMVTPPANISNDVLAAAWLCGVRDIYQVGGAQAIAALAYGTETIPRVDKIVGPGNAYVAMAKKLVFGDTGIDTIAGPSEVVIIADSNVKSEYVVADLMAQAEHGSGASARLLTPSKQLYKQVHAKIGRFSQVKLTLVKNMQEAVKLANQLAPEHVELLTKNAKTLSAGITNAGAIFIGNYTPTATGDYIAGPSHVLPTGGTARFSGGLSSADFVKRSSILNYTEKALWRAAGDIIAIAEREGLKFHAASVIQRTEKGKAGK